MSDAFALGSFLARWSHRVRHDLSASESATLSLSELLALASEADRRRWEVLDFGYTSPHGSEWLRVAIAERYEALDPGQILCCAGAQEGLACVMRALLRPGDHAVVVVPIYQPCEHAVTAICAASGVALTEAHGLWRLDIDRVAAALTPATRLVLVNFPNSPTGAAIDTASLAALVALCRRHGVWLVNDEVYRVVGSDPADCPPPVADLYERGVSVNALSKGFGLPGLRVGWVACRELALLDRVLLAKSGLSSCLAAPSEVLAHIALRAEGPIIARNRAIARANRALLLDFLARRAGLFEGHVPPHAALAYPRYLGTEGVDRFAERLAREASVLVLPSALWQTGLAPTPSDRLRIGLGRPRMDEALALLDAHLSRPARKVAVSVA
jgi:aspartate/methionine/tyrosine aminotransferase